MLTADEVLATIETHKDELRALGVTRIGLFGSVARGEAGPDSDLDFIVEFDEFRRISYDAYIGTQFLLEDLFQRKVDIGSLDDLRPRLRKHVLPELRYATI